MVGLCGDSGSYFGQYIQTINKKHSNFQHSCFPYGSNLIINDYGAMHLENHKISSRDDLSVHIAMMMMEVSSVVQNTLNIEVGIAVI
ncbi:hypothetical protein L2E82_42037 [Cichorium intybus]|uniref:Uncharacterized protein n=1 Tax=Cichorium intybus TaxID=13427 RepID=A0ACB8ZL64_CICIN|nr:hypothetical protein L2E82_42037 [Cichorium intybus]